MQNPSIERLNRLFREDILDAYLFEDLEELRILADEWMDGGIFRTVDDPAEIQE